MVKYQNLINKTLLTPLDRLAKSIYYNLQGPEMIEWFPTYNCNSHCAYCGGYDQKTVDSFEGIIPQKRMLSLVEQSSRNGSLAWNIGGRGGEPFLYPQLIDILEMIKACNMKGILITNGLLLNAEIAQRLVAVGWDILRISLDSHLEKVHDKIRGVNGCFAKVNKIFKFIQMAKKNNHISYTLIRVCPVISNENYGHLDLFMEYCINQGVDEIHFMPLLEVHEGARGMSLSDEQQKELIDILSKKRFETRIQHNIDFIISLYKNFQRKSSTVSAIFNEKELYCIHLWKTLVISEDGYISPCSLIKNKIEKIDDSLLKVWDSKALNALRKKILAGKMIDPACSNCCGPLRSETTNFNQYASKSLNGKYSMSRILNVPIVPPEMIIISLTESCNLKCSICSIKKDINQNNIKVDKNKIFDIARQARMMNIKTVVLSGGEPFLVAEIFEIASYINSLGLNISVTTNGFYNKQMVEMISKSHIDHIHFSLDGLKESNDFIRGKGSYDHAMEAIKHLRLLNKKKSIGIGTVIFSKNCNDLFKLTQIADALKVNSINFIPYLVNNTNPQYSKKGCKHSLLWPDNYGLKCLSDNFQRIKEHRYSYLKVDSNPSFDLLLDYYSQRTIDKPCCAGHKSIIITAPCWKNGKASSEVFFCQGSCGNIYDMSLKDAWYSQKAAEMRLITKQCKNSCLQFCHYD